MSIFRRNRDDDFLEAEGGKIYKIINTVAMIGIIIALTILVVSAVGFIKFTSGLVGFIATLFILSLALSMSLYWVKKLEKNEFKKTSIVFLSMIAICATLWIICFWLGIDVYNKLKSGNEEGATTSFFNTFNFIKWTLIISMQFFFVSFVGQGITRYKKDMVIWQGISYVSYLYIDFYVTYFISIIDLNSESLVNFKDSLLVNKVVLMFLILFVIYLSIATTVMRKKLRKKLAKIVSDADKTQNNKSEGDFQTLEKVEDKETEVEKLTKLKDLLNQGLITQEEYDQKKSEIIKNL